MFSLNIEHMCVHVLKVPWHGLILLFYNVSWVAFIVLICFLDKNTHNLVIKGIFPSWFERKW